MERSVNGPASAILRYANLSISRRATLRCASSIENQGIWLGYAENRDRQAQAALCKDNPLNEPMLLANARNAGCQASATNSSRRPGWRPRTRMQVAANRCATSV